MNCFLNLLGDFWRLAEDFLARTTVQLFMTSFTLEKKERKGKKNTVLNWSQIKISIRGRRLKEPTRASSWVHPRAGAVSNVRMIGAELRDSSRQSRKVRVLRNGYGFVLCPTRQATCHEHKAPPSAENGEGRGGLPHFREFREGRSGVREGRERPAGAQATPCRSGLRFKASWVAAVSVPPPCHTPNCGLGSNPFSAPSLSRPHLQRGSQGAPTPRRTAAKHRRNGERDVGARPDPAECADDGAHRMAVKVWKP